MNFSSILSKIEGLDPEVCNRPSERRSVIKNLARGVSLAAVPFALGSIFNKAHAKTNDVVEDALNFLLTLEYLQDDLYKKAILATRVNPPSVQLIPANTGLELPAIQRISNLTTQHVKFIQDTIRGMGFAAITKPVFDFTGGKGTGTGPYTNVFSNYGAFLALAQMLEDMGVRAFKGQLFVFKATNDLLTTLFRIHAVKARHAAHLRMMRYQTPGPLSDNTNTQPWVTKDNSGIASPDYSAAYAGEQNTSQAGVEIVNINSFLIDDVLASEAFDELLNMNDTNSIVDLFITP